MKKLVLTAAIVLGFAMSTYADGIFQNNENNNNGLFGRGAVQRGADEGTPFLPTHGVAANGDANQEPELPAPLGSGAILLIGFGAAYAMSKKNKKD